jgi:hypothetical protein
MSRLYRGRKMLERTLLEYAKKYGYIRSGEPAKMRSRKDEVKPVKKKTPSGEEETEVQEPEEEEAVLFAADEDFEFELPEEEEEEFQVE